MNRAESKVSEYDMLLLEKQPWGCFMTHDGELRPLSLQDRVLLERLPAGPLSSICLSSSIAPRRTQRKLQLADSCFGSSGAEALRGWFIWTGQLPERMDMESKSLQDNATLCDTTTPPLNEIVHILGRGRVDKPEDCGNESGATLHQHIFKCAAALPQGESTMLRVNARVDMSYIHRHMQAWTSRWLGLPDDSAFLLLHRREAFRRKMSPTTIINSK